MIILEDVGCEIFDILITKRTAMVSIDCLFDAFFAVDMPTSRDVAILDLPKANCTGKLGKKLIRVQ